MIYDDKAELLGEIAAGEDTLLELKEVVIKGDQVRFAGEAGRAPKVIAEVFVSMANIAHRFRPSSWGGCWRAGS